MGSGDFAPCETRRACLAKDGEDRVQGPQPCGPVFLPSSRGAARYSGKGQRNSRRYCSTRFRIASRNGVQRGSA